MSSQRGSTISTMTMVGYTTCEKICTKGKPLNRVERRAKEANLKKKKRDDARRKR